MTEYEQGFDDGEKYIIHHIDDVILTLSTDQLWSLFSAIQMELEGRDLSRSLEDLDDSYGTRGD